MSTQTAVRPAMLPVENPQTPIFEIRRATRNGLPVEYVSRKCDCCGQSVPAQEIIRVDKNIVAELNAAIEKRRRWNNPFLLLICIVLACSLMIISANYLAAHAVISGAWPLAVVFIGSSILALGPYWIFLSRFDAMVRSAYLEARSRLPEQYRDIDIETMSTTACYGRGYLLLPSGATEL